MGNFEIVTISNRYKDTLDNLIDSSNPKFPDSVGPIDEKFRNALMSKGSSIDLLEGDYLDKDLPDRLLRLTPQTEHLQVRQRRVVVPWARYGKSQRGGEDR